MKKIPSSIFIVPFLVLALSGCVISFQGSKTGTGGIYSSADGKTWQQQNFVAQVKKRLITIGSINIKKIFLDPKDNNTMYLATVGNGIYVSHDAAQNWSAFYGSSATINDIAIHPKNNSTIYALIGNQIHKTDDSGLNWSIVFTDTSPGAVLNTIAIDKYNTNRIFVGSNLGSLTLSVDNGKSWQTILRVDKGNIQKIAIAPSDTRTMYLTTSTSGLQRSKDAGTTWENITRNITQYPGAVSIYDITVDQKNNNHITLVTQHGILVTKDGGENWDRIKLLTEYNTVRIWSFAIQSDNSNVMYYALPGTFYSTKDGGKTWVSTPLPVAHIPMALIITPGKNPILYMGFTLVQEKKSGFIF